VGRQTQPALRPVPAPFRRMGAASEAAGPDLHFQAKQSNLGHRPVHSHGLKQTSPDQILCHFDLVNIVL
jgi:hypothetical protein